MSPLSDESRRSEFFQVSLPKRLGSILLKRLRYLEFLHLLRPRLQRPCLRTLSLKMSSGNEYDDLLDEVLSEEGGSRSSMRHSKFNL